MIAFLDSLGLQEMFLLVVIGLLLYGRNLPEAGRNLGRLLAQVKRGFQEFKDQLNRDAELNDVKKTLKDTTQELRRVAQVPRAMVNPGLAVRDFARDAMSSPPPEVEPPAEPSAPGPAEAKPTELQAPPSEGPVPGGPAPGGLAPESPDSR